MQHARLVPLAVLSVMLAASSASAAETSKPIVEPDWIEKPTFEQMEPVYPAIGTALGIDGSAVLSCHVLANGRLQGCQVTSETPAELGFGKAALSLASYFRMSPKLEGGRPVEGSISIPIRFAMAPDDPLPPRPQTPEGAAPISKAPPSAEALGLARRLVAATHVERLLKFAARANVSEWMVKAKGEAKAMVYFAAMDALTEAMAAQAPKYLERAAEIYARTLSLAELRESVRFYESPAGRAYEAARITTSFELGIDINADMDLAESCCPRQILRQARLRGQDRAGDEPIELRALIPERGEGRRQRKTPGRFRPGVLFAQSRVGVDLRSPCRPCRPCRRRACRRRRRRPFLGASAMAASVVISRPATEAASCRAVRTTLAGSMTPACDHVDVLFGLGVEAEGRRLVRPAPCRPRSSLRRRRFRRSDGSGPAGRGGRWRCRRSGRRCRPSGLRGPWRPSAGRRRRRGRCLLPRPRGSR